MDILERIKMGLAGARPAETGQDEFHESLILFAAALQSAHLSCDFLTALPMVRPLFGPTPPGAR